MSCLILMFMWPAGPLWLAGRTLLFGFLWTSLGMWVATFEPLSSFCLSSRFWIPVRS